MKIAVMGASGTMGSLVSGLLEHQGADVVRAQRSTGVDAVTGDGLAAALSGADVVVDCLNSNTQSGRKAKAFFGTAAGNIGRIVAGTDARLVCLSICQATDPAVNRTMGYYQGKAAQEATYRTLLGDRATMVRTTQWFELAETLVGRMSVGPLAVMPHMVTAPLAAADGAAVIADTALGRLHRGASAVEVRGPERMDLVDVGRALRRQAGRPGPIAVDFGGLALRDGRLIPEHADVVTATTLQEWLA
ncbi:MAG: NmrA family transcriptional regulator [Gordonia sp. (in: high G+C Gram-positive bacteria)]|uniref:SDR family oxidoreductase n=1 Tax=Gordonia sp. (in: high G+C Gram-positive bacteria) TaxID=84139 RepID=UPI0039E41303